MRLDKERGTLIELDEVLMGGLGLLGGEREWRDDEVERGEFEFLGFFVWFHLYDNFQE